TISRHLENMVRGLDEIELSTLLKADARIFTFTAGKKEETTASELDLPNDARIIFYYRDNEFRLAEKDTRFRKGDEIVVLTHSKNLADLRERWYPKKVSK
ncbi:MAG: hypothetical protein JW856_01195, partial [Dehalococcoidales bacterium]|nr:hypothetical protein [Dehalococcoidales bacterium]